ncbi:MAG TPA: RNA polymerase subunit sigma-24 [Bacteroidetes bacterium]|nr:RNA polymerase subunit sigma-24 [Bacteroidota bacterium]
MSWDGRACIFLINHPSSNHNLFSGAGSNTMSKETIPNHSTAMQDLDLISKAKRGDMGAFEQLVFRYDKQVLSIAARYVQSSEDAKDIYQEVFLRVYRSLPKFQLRSEFSTWLYRVTTNVCLSHRSRRKRHTHASIDRESDEEHGASLSDSLKGDLVTDRQAEGSDVALHVQQAVESLSPKQRMVFTLKHYQGYKIREIAVMMECTEGAVKKYLFTATRRLRAQLREAFGGA